MDISSSEELSSDSELDEIVEMSWKKTKNSITDSNSEAECDFSENDNSELQGDEQNLSLFVIDKKPSVSKEEASAKGDGDTSERVTVNSRTEVHKKLEKGKSKKRFNPNFKRLELSSSLQVTQDLSDIYINLHTKQLPELKYKTNLEHINKDHEEIMKKSVVTPDFEKKHSVPTYDESLRHKRKERKKEREKTKGRGWFDMPRGEITEETKNDLLALKMRRALDPKRFYRSDDIKGLPKYFQFGTVVEDASEFYSARIPKKQRKKSIVEELMADADFRKFNKRKYTEVQELKAKGLGPYKGIRTMKTKKKKKK